MLSRFFLLCAVFFFAFLSQELHSQSSSRAIVRGRVVDDSTKSPLPLANVFIANSTIGTTANVEGKFEMKGVPLGMQQIVASIVGYVPRSVTLNLTDTTEYEVELQLKSRPVQMPLVEVEAKDPEEWKKQLQKFNEVFFGSTLNSPKCRLLNPQVLDFAVDEGTELFIATAREPLEIENTALGYRVQYFLQYFAEKRGSFQFVGMTKFVPLQSTDEDKIRQWKENRRNAYYGSKRHFLSSLVRKNTQREGFEVNSIYKDWLQSALRVSTGFEVNPDTLLAPAGVPHERRLSFPDMLQIVYYHNRKIQISLIQMDQPSVLVYTNGLLADPLRVTTYGYWSSQRVAEMLPTDYEPD